ncbi:MAG: DNA polymerase III subunit delta [Candidatus Tectomicrobia bacterium]|uniref:DNA polymerase III subunit delta n=1 Tax=Tectimicrobiota bacterium TaxID=2528274 RepID=A0A932I1S1_UNCTE|nr:DNA polymerase III subunit delta [Candidatus Tectomicrobia bacterium]
MAARRSPGSSGAGLRLLLADLKKGKLSPLYLLHGPEALLRDQAVQAIRRAVLPKEAADFNYDRFHWPEAKAADVAAAAQTLPFMAERRLVEVRGFEQVKEEDAGVLLPLVERPPETAVLLFITDKADMRFTFFRKLAQAGVEVRLEAPSESELPEWARAQAAELGITLRLEAANLLVEMVERSLGRLRAELEKLATYVGPGGEAGEEEVREVVGRSRVDAMFKLGDTLAAGDTAGALVMLRRLCETESQYALVGMLRSQLRRWLSAKALSLKGRPAREVASVLKIPPFAAERLAQEVRGASGRFLRELYGKLVEVDRRIKRTGDDRRRREALEMLILEMGQDPGGFGRRKRTGAGGARPS